MQDESAISGATPDVIGSQSSTDASTAAASSPVTDTGTSSADVQAQQPVQGQDSTAQDDPLAGFPPDNELDAAVASKTPFAEMAARIKGAYTQLKPQFDEISQKFSVFETAQDRFQSPEEFQKVLNFQDNLFKWDNDPQTGVPIPNTDQAAVSLHEEHLEHANDLFGRLSEMPVFDSVTGQTMSRWDVMLHGAAEDQAERAKVAKIFGLMEPSAVAPQWQPTEDELAIVRPELQDTYRKLPFEEREELKLNSPEYINRTLEREKFTQQLQEEKRQNDLRTQQETEHREQYVNQQAMQAGQTYLNEQLNSALATFHESVVQQCNFIKPLDPQSLPQGVTPEQAQQMNQQIAASNKAEAAQVTGLIVSLFNPQTKEYVLPLLREIGAVDDKMLSQLDQAASAFGNNARNFGNLSYRQKLTANGNGSELGPNVTQLNNEAQRALKSMIGYANQIKGKLLEKRSQFFELKATEHNTTLNGAATVRPPINGQGYNPTTAPAPVPSKAWPTREEIFRQYS